MEQVQDSIREYLVDLKIPAGNGLHGKTVESAGLRHLPGLFLVEIRRGDQVIAPPKPDQLLLSGDTLTFTGLVTTIVDLKHQFGLVPVADGGYVADAAEQRGRMLCEAVVSHSSPLIGKTIRDNDFRALYNAAVVAVHRGGERLTGRVGDIVVHPGDTMLLQAGPHFVRAHQNDPDFLLVSGIENGRPVRRDKALLSIGLLAALVAMMASGHIPIVLAAFLVAGAMIITRCISVANARQSVDLQTLLTICAAFGLGTALVNAGVVEAVADMVANTVGAWGPYAVLMGVYILTSVFTEVVTNNAAAALMFPFAVAFAQQIGANPRPFVMAVAFAASASFMTPLGYQTNLMVFGPGGYRFSDFVRLGLPLNLLLMLVATILIPLVWPF